MGDGFDCGAVGRHEFAPYLCAKRLEGETSVQQNNVSETVLVWVLTDVRRSKLPDTASSEAGERYVRGMRLIRRAAPLLVALAACGSGSSAPDPTVAETVAPSTVPASTTTEAPFATADEPAARCDTDGLRAAFKSKMVMGACTANWAAGNLDRDTWNCPDRGCRQVRLFHRVGGKWTATAVCDSSLPLTLWRVSCFRGDLTAVTVDHIPSPAIQCRVWPANVALRNVAETGCTPPKSVIADALKGKCERWSENFKLPLEKCDSGSAVRLVQKALVKAGHALDPDGYFGSDTVRAVMEVQKGASLLATGLVDLGTWRVIFPANAGLKGSDTNGDGVISAEELS